ncbi:MAG TPA: formate dehydrogenase subunit gamma [Candidatus Methylomirabilis sp.]|nr:formate dehydrogenase subunit gamma [Candidatus Methylomirabilis sp.]
MARTTSSNHSPVSARTRRRRTLLWSLALILAGAMVLPLGGYLYLASRPAFAQSAAPEQQPTNPRANYWRAVRGGMQGYTAASGPYTKDVLIQNGGQNWREIRNGPVSTYTPWILAVMILAIGLHYFIRGPSRLVQPRSGAKVERWSLPERVLHWYTATLFILMAITGLSVLFGRAVLVPVLGLDGNAAYAAFAIAVHNYLGPFFVVGVLLEIIAWFRYNIPNRTDVEWFKQGGGVIGNKHPSAGRLNGGEKAWYWIITTVGVAVCLTGLVLDFPNFGQSREAMQLANVIHAVCAIGWLAIALGHIYIGTLGAEGALEGMTTGYVSVEWAKQHHDLWYEEVSREGVAATGKPAGTRPRPASS